VQISYGFDIYAFRIRTIKGTAEDVTFFPTSGTKLHGHSPLANSVLNFYTLTNLNIPMTMKS